MLNRGVVAVDRTLGPVREALSDAGFSVIGPEDAALRHPVAIVVDGLDDNIMGIQQPVAQAPVINADGLTTEDVLREVERRAGA